MESPTKQHGHTDPESVPTVGQIFSYGKRMKMWDDGNQFYTIISYIIHRPVTRDNARGVDPYERDQIMKNVDSVIAYSREEMHKFFVHIAENEAHRLLEGVNNGEPSRPDTSGNSRGSSGKPDRRTTRNRVQR